jgi:hypothetical protein
VKLPVLPCEVTISGDFLSGSGQSFTPGNANDPKSTSAGGWEQGYQIAPLSAEPSASPGI